MRSFAPKGTGGLYMLVVVHGEVNLMSAQQRILPHPTSNSSSELPNEKGQGETLRHSGPSISLNIFRPSSHLPYLVYRNHLNHKPS